MKRALLLLLLCGCAGYDKQIAAHRAAYGADTVLQEKMLEPLQLEPSHGQVTVAVTRKLAEKILLASLKPNALVVSVRGRGRAWKGAGKRLGIGYENGVWVNQGQLGVSLAASELALDDDTVTLRARIEGHGAVSADLRFFGVSLTREVELALHHDAPLHLKLETAPGGWVLRAVGEPLRAEVQLQLPAMTVAGVDLYTVKIDRQVELGLEQLRPWPVPLPAPREVDVGPERVRIGLVNPRFGAHAGRLWLGADLSLAGVAPTAN